MIYGIVGGRTYRALHLVRDYVMGLPVGDYDVASPPPASVVVSGHAAGVDIVAEITAHQRGLPTVIFPARGASHAEFTKAAFARNTLIAQRSDELDAFVNSESRGTWDTVQKARLFGKVVRIHEEPAEPALLFHTAVHPNTRQAPRGYRGPSMLDITRGSGREGLPFAPSAALLSEARSNGFDWYKPRYVEEMRQSWKANRAAWDLLLGRNHVVCVCYCADRDLCHRGLFAALIVKAGEWSGRRVIDGGEVVLPSRPPSVSKGDDQPAQ